MRPSPGWVAIAVVCFASIGGCATSRPTIVDARAAYYGGQYDLAAEMLDGLAENGSLASVCQLDLAMVDLAAGRYESASSRLRALRDEFHRRSGAIAGLDPIGDAAALATDDNAKRFELSPEEQTLVRTLLSIAELAGGGVDAESYSLQAMMHRAETMRRSVCPADRDIALTPYVRGLIRESNHHDYDDAAAAYQLVAATQPNFAPIGEDIRRAGGGVHSQSGHGVLYVFCLTGRGPVLMDVEAETTTAALSIASAIWASKVHADDENDAAALPNIASVRVPAVVVPPSPTAAVQVSVNDQPLGMSQTVTDMAAIASRRLEDGMPTIMARAILRRAAKEAAVAATTRAMGVTGDAASLLHFAATSTWASIERADTRCWSLLPREFQVFRVELPVGVHRVRCQPVDSFGAATGPGVERAVEILDGENEYVVTASP